MTRDSVGWHTPQWKDTRLSRMTHDSGMTRVWDDTRLSGMTATQWGDTRLSGMTRLSGITRDSVG